MLKVVNVNSRYVLSPAQISFIEKVIMVYSPYFHRHTSLAYIADTVPIYLLDKHSMPSLEEIDNEDSSCSAKRVVKKSKRFKKKKPATDVLGFYNHNYSFYNSSTPVIGLCPELIGHCVENDEELCIVSAVVIIHQLARAMMAHKNYKPDYAPKDEFYHWMEPPLANAIAFAAISTFASFGIHSYSMGYDDKSLFKSWKLTSFVKEFINKQPDNYKLGIDLFEKGCKRYMTSWAFSQSVVQEKTAEKEAYLKYVKANVGNCNKQVLKELLDDLFNS